MTITQSCLSYGSLVQILTENNKEERKTSFQTTEEITILGSKRMKILQRNKRGIYRHNSSRTRMHTSTQPPPHPPTHTEEDAATDK